MKSRTKMVILGTITFSCGMFIGFKVCKAIILSMVNDKEYMKSKIVPILEKHISIEKLDRMAKIYYEKEVIK